MDQEVPDAILDLDSLMQQIIVILNTTKPRDFERFRLSFEWKLKTLNDKFAEIGVFPHK